jgi:hypothetical protein
MFFDMSRILLCFVLEPYMIEKFFANTYSCFVVGSAAAVRGERVNNLLTNFDGRAATCIELLSERVIPERWLSHAVGCWTVINR